MVTAIFCVFDNKRVVGDCIGMRGITHYCLLKILLKRYYVHNSSRRWRRRFEEAK